MGIRAKTKRRYWSICRGNPPKLINYGIVTHKNGLLIRPNLRIYLSCWPFLRGVNPTLTSLKIIILNQFCTCLFHQKASYKYSSGSNFRNIYPFENDDHWGFHHLHFHVNFISARISPTITKFCSIKGTVHSLLPGCSI